jgi:hypothetical protein
MRGVSRSGVVFALAVLTSLALPAGAWAAFGNAADDSDGAQLVSADYERLEQGDDSTVYAAISSDGRYVAIQTRARNFFADDDADPPGQYRAGGVFRFDRQARTLAKVADGDLFDEASNEFVRRGASNPSISADGRYVAFATAQPLIPADTNQNVDVYVRDMAHPTSDPAAFDLVSARDGSNTPASYGPPALPFPGSEPGVEISRGVAISADGLKVVFRTDAPSDLPASATTDVPAGQVFVRNRVADTTALVTARRDAGSGEMTDEPAGGAVNAGISADGSTVTWTGSKAAAQTRFLAGESQEPSFLYYLWRRVADGPSAQTRRITGLSDPDDPDCPPEVESSFNQTATGPCFGPLTDQEANRSSISAQLPALSGNGYTVAFLTGSGPRPLSFTGTGLDLYVTDMTPGLSRKEATVELTRDPADFNPATSSPLTSIAMSSGGRYLAVATVRTDFTLPALQVVGEPRPVSGPRELYMVDLEDRTLERVTHSYSGGDIDSDVQNGVSVTADGSSVAFTAFAGNLFFGDANQRTDAFVATRRPDPEAAPEDLGPRDNGPAGTIETEPGGPTIAARAKSKPGGLVVVTVSVPAAGGVRAVAKARAGEPPKQRVLATANARAAGTARSEVRLELRPVERYRPELRERKRISGRALVSYVASRGGRHASASVRVTFALAPGPSKSSKRGQK